MSLSSLIDYLLKHNEAVIQWLIVVIIGMISFLAIRSVFRKPVTRSAGAAPAGAALGSSEQIEELLNKILDKTNKWDQGAKPAAEGSAPAGDGVSAQELEAAKSELAVLKSALEKKDAELSAAMAAGTSAAGDGAANKQFLDKISELEAKLSEYEVLEDDIADLSLYKEENARLKAEVDRLRGGAVDEAPVGAAGVPEPDMADDLVREFAEAVGKDATPTSPVEELAAEPEPQLTAEDLVVPQPEEPEISPLAAEAASDDSGMSAEDLAALNELAAAASDPAPEAGEALAPTPAPQSQEAVDDLFAELASSDLDTDKVVSELAALQNLGASGSADEALADGVDPDKIAEEADGLKS